MNVCARGEALHRDDLSVVPLEAKGSLNSPRRCRACAKSHTPLSLGLSIPVGCTCPCPARVGSVLVARVSGAVVARGGKITSPLLFLGRACSIPAGMNHLTPISEELKVAAFWEKLVFCVCKGSQEHLHQRVSLLTSLTVAVFPGSIMCITFKVLLCSLGPRQLQKGKLRFCRWAL